MNHELITKPEPSPLQMDMLDDTDPYRVGVKYALSAVIETNYESENTVHDIRSRPGSYESSQRYAEQIRNGTMPPLENGFSIVVDRRPAGKEADHIPAADYTRYFSQRQVPVADADHATFQHDMTHIDGYKRIFAYDRLAETIHTGAVNALNDPAKSSEFTGAMDSLGDALNSFWHTQEASGCGDTLTTGHLNAFKYNLGRLVELARPDASDAEKLELSENLYGYFGLRRYESTARINTRRKYTYEHRYTNKNV